MPLVAAELYLLAACRYVSPRTVAVIRLQTFIQAPVERCFDLARSIDLHTVSMAEQNEKAVGGKTQGLIELGEAVTWQARHFGISQRLTSKITAFDRPHHFRDTMVAGAFRRFDHDHLFEPQGNTTLMTDVFDYRAPLGFLGSIAERLFLTRYMADLLRARNKIIKEVAEGDQWAVLLNT